MQPIVLQIQMSPQGQIHVSGPLADKVLCFGLLEAAKDAVRAYEQKPQPGVAIPAPELVPGLLNGGSRR
jgi:hypothetical protein